MAFNPRTHHQNLHTAYIAGSGGGKSTLLRQHLPKSGARAVFWDIDRDHRAHHIESFRVFVRELGRAHRSGKPFRIAYAGDDTPELFQLWCRAVWAILDGERPTHVVVEELADVETSTGKAGIHWGRLLRKGRKFGARISWTTQRPQEVSKTAVAQCGTRYIGLQDSFNDADVAAKYANTTADKITTLEPLMFWKKEQRVLVPTLVDLRGLFTRNAGEKGSAKTQA